MRSSRIRITQGSPIGGPFSCPRPPAYQYIRVGFHRPAKSKINDVGVSVGLNGANNGVNNGAKITSCQNAILALMAHNLEITLDTIAKEIGISASTLDQEIAKMAHLVQRIGLSTF